jgi:hypothetical protein
MLQGPNCIGGGCSTPVNTVTLRLPARTDLGEHTGISSFLDVISSRNVLKVKYKRPRDVFDLLEDDPEAVDGLLDYLYPTKYPSNLDKHNLKSLETEAKANNSDYTAYAVMYWNFGLAMFKIAHKYDLSHLEGETQES